MAVGYLLEQDCETQRESSTISPRVQACRKRLLFAFFFVLMTAATLGNKRETPTETTPTEKDDDSSFIVTKLSAARADRVLNVHIVPHTHDDVGWRKTVDQYYYGWNNSIDTRGNVASILSTTVEALLENPSRTFTYVEQKFFSMWWNDQPEAVRDSVRFLIANRQLFFVNGGWCMHDEAASHYIGMIDQTTLGHTFLKHELGVIPTVGWQLDPFGHSATQASLMTSRLGFDALYFGRIDYQDLALRRLTRQCEGLWNASSSFSDSTVFWGLTGSYGGNYGAPPGFCFDVQCDHDEYLVGSNETRLQERLEAFLQDLRVQSDQTVDNHIMLTFGMDFQYLEAHINYANMVRSPGDRLENGFEKNVVCFEASSCA
jgi:alpha-mannosidase